MFEQSGADVVYANGIYISDNRRDAMLGVSENNEKIKRIYNSAPFKPWYLYFGWIPLHTTLFVKREVFNSYGLYQEQYRIASDYEISLRWFTNSALKKQYMDRWTVKMLLGGKSTTAGLQKRKSMEDLDILQRYKLWGPVTLAFKIARKIPQYVFVRQKSKE